MGLQSYMKLGEGTVLYCVVMFHLGKYFADITGWPAFRNANVYLYSDWQKSCTFFLEFFRGPLEEWDQLLSHILLLSGVVTSDNVQRIKSTKHFSWYSITQEGA